MRDATDHPTFKPNVAGVESEVHVFAVGAGTEHIRQSAAEKVLRHVIRSHGLGRCRTCENDGCGRAEFIRTGARCYLDHGYVEYSTPPSASTAEAVAAVRAGDAVIRQAAAEASKDLPEGSRLLAVRNTCDHQGHSYAAHVNVSMTRQGFAKLIEDDGDLLHETVGPLFVSMPLICGAGRVGSEDREDIFQLSQRADFIETDRGLQTVDHRPLLNIRDEPLADRESHGRLHTIPFDANRLQTPEYLKIGLLRILCASIDLRIPTVAIPTGDLPIAMRHVSRRPFAPLRLKNGKTMAPLEVQRAFFAPFAKRSDDLAQRVPDIEAILARWDKVLIALEKDFLQLVGVLDWVSKYVLLEGTRAKQKLDWNDPRLIWLDISYHELTGGDRNCGSSLTLADLGPVTSDKDVENLTHGPPEGGRPALRAALLRRFADEAVACDWHWIATADGRCYLLDDPTMAPAESDRIIHEAETLAEAAARLGLRDQPAEELIVLYGADQTGGDRQMDAATVPLRTSGGEKGQRETSQCDE